MTQQAHNDLGNSSAGTKKSPAESAGAKKKLRLVDQDASSIDAELAAFEAAERSRLGLDKHTEQWIEDMAGLQFSKGEKSNITLLTGGLTYAQDLFAEAALRGVGYNVVVLDAPDTAAFQTGKEYGNRAQCNPTYFTVGNLIKYLITLRDKHGMSAEEIVNKYVFLTAGACGPCRFGMYITEYRKALRDAGFDGFRVMQFSQTPNAQGASPEESGLQLNGAFFWGLAKGLFAGDVLNAIGYRIRPYEVEPGATDIAIAESKKIIYDALANNKLLIPALLKCKPHFAKVKVDWLQAKPRVSIIGEFWAMTTEGEGNYEVKKFLEGEGAESDVQLLAAWILYSLWELRYDAGERADLRGADTSYYGLGGSGPFGAMKKLLTSRVGDVALRALFQSFAYSMGLYGYVLPDMDEVAEAARDHYHRDLRGGEGHMEVGKLVINVTKKKAHMTLGVKPFGCMPSAGVSDGVQSLITEKFPGAIYCPVETSGDGKVNFYSRVQMFLFKAKQAAQEEFDQALAENGVTLEQVREFVAKNPRFASALHRAPHRYAGTGADLVAEVAPYLTMSRARRMQVRAWRLIQGTQKVAKAAPHMVVQLIDKARAEGPDLAQRVKEDVSIFLDLKKGKQVVQDKLSDLSAAAE